MNSMEYQTFCIYCFSDLNKHAPVKKTYLRANHPKFITKELMQEL